MSRSIYTRLFHRFSPDRFNASRRDALRATAALAGGVLLSGSAFAWARPLRRNGKRIVIVGAGFAGLACAHELASVGYDVRVIEARKRVGGRVLSFSDFIAGKNVEGGGELIGSNHPAWYAYKERFGLKYLDVSEDEDAAFPIVLGGKRLGKEDANKLFEEMDEAFSSMNEDAKPVVVDEPWKTPNAAALDARTTRAWLDSLETSELARLGMAAVLVNDNGVAPAMQSYLGNLSQVAGGGFEAYWTATEAHRLDGGNGQVAQKLAEAIGKDRILLGAPVASIQIGGGASPVRVSTADGTRFEADDVVLAVPPSVWESIKIDPELPKSLRPQMGVNVKYLAAVKRRFWKDFGMAPDTLSDGEVGMTWDSTDGQEGEEGICLTAFSGGPGAAACRSRAGEARDKAYAERIEELLPGYQEHVEKTRFMDWPAEEWTKASYSFPAPGQITSMGPVMREGLGKLHFAGEHTCYKFVGYMEGGLNSGVSLARRIAARDGLKIPELPVPPALVPSEEPDAEP